MSAVRWNGQQRNNRPRYQQRFYRNDLERLYRTEPERFYGDSNDFTDQEGQLRMRPDLGADYDGHFDGHMRGSSRYGRDGFNDGRFGREGLVRFSANGHDLHRGDELIPARSRVSLYGYGLSDQSTRFYSDQAKNLSDQMLGHAGRGPKNYKKSDERIEEQICEYLTESPFLDATDIEVKVKNCEVTLSGFVDSRQAKREAEELAESVSGIKDVTNNIKVKATRWQDASSQSSQHSTSNLSGVKNK